MGDPRLDSSFLDRRHDPEIYPSPVTLWEITIKEKTGKPGGAADLAAFPCITAILSTDCS